MSGLSVHVVDGGVLSTNVADGFARLEYVAVGCTLSVNVVVGSVLLFQLGPAISSLSVHIGDGEQLADGDIDAEGLVD